MTEETVSTQVEAENGGDTNQTEDVGGDKNVAITQAELDALIDKRLARDRRKHTKETAQQALKEDSTQSDDYSAKLEMAQRQVAQAEIKSAMVIAGVDPEKVNRAYRLIEADSVLEEGEIVGEKVKTEIEDLLKTFPELLKTKSAEAGSFKIGEEVVKQKTNNEEIAKAFGVS